MATNSELLSLYGELRATLLARHFAIGRYFRTNYLSLTNYLGCLHRPGSGKSADEDDIEIGCDAERVHPSKYISAADLVGKDEVTQRRERWRVTMHGRENPLLFSSQLLICLAVERFLGRVSVKPIILAALRTIGSMYKFKGAFRGYPVRWDAVTSDPLVHA
jgi:hypothetical protein